MEIVCRCSSCGARFKVDAKAAGRKARCPTCATVVIVPLQTPPGATSPGATSAGDGNASRFLDSAPSAEGATSLDYTELAGMKFGSADAPPAPSQVGQSPSVVINRHADDTAAPPVPEVRTPEPASAGVAIVTKRGRATERLGSERVGTDRTSSGGTGRPRSSSRLLLWVLGGGALALSITVGLIVWLASHLDQGNSPVGVVSGKTSLLINWPEGDRKGALLKINGQDQALAAAGPLTFPLTEGSHRLTILRRGFEQIDYGFTLRKGEQHTFQPDWTESSIAHLTKPGIDKNSTKPAAGTGKSPANSDASGAAETYAGPLNFAGFGQSLDVAVRKATERKKDIFLVFAGSDWNTDSIRMATELFSNARFQQFLQPRFEAVVIDMPRTEAGLNLLGDIAQNRQLIRRFGIRSVPTIVLLDAGGTPYIIDGIFEEGVDKYIQHLTLLQAKHNTRDARLAAVDAARGKSAEEQLQAYREALTWLADGKLTFFYPKLISQGLTLARRVDDTNSQGLQELFFEVDWENRLRQAAIDNEAPKIQSVLEELRQWSDTHTFQDPNRAVRLHLSAVAVLLRIPDALAAARPHLDAAKRYTPTDVELQKALQNAAKALQSSDQLSSGTGFIVDRRGYILTNHHVIRGPGNIVIRLPGAEQKRVPAQVVAQDPRRDIALLRVDPSQFEQFDALRFSSQEAARATSVAVFGFPLGDDIGTDVRITTGVVSALPEQSEEGMLLLDCRINPGNSGGPVVSRSGQVLGMVTAKTDVRLGLDSYGMALPVRELVTFLKQALPDWAGVDDAAATPTEREWKEIDSAVNSAVLMILKVKT
ncbi:MAG: trypsin-like peptidase domain-containing protein [Planctomycetota bacterium]